MIRLFAAALACVLLAGCTTTNSRVNTQAAAVRPAAGTRIVLMTPDVDLGLLTAAGMTEPRADWSRAARDNLASQIETAVKARQHAYSTANPDDAMTGRVGQLLRLNSTVGASIMTFGYTNALPTKKGSFDWTLGEGAQALSTAYDADYALFFTGRGTYASEGRVATAVGLALLGVSVPLGQQVVYASLIDLRTGKVVWFNVAVAGPSDDMRKSEGAAGLVAAVFKDIPL
ncbi:MAG TPA: hypothetical protein VEA15_09980 [Caulobacteraceae bacterium]|nr:hypothetical protein [Caulobacteraceae bacterium]